MKSAACQKGFTLIEAAVAIVVVALVVSSAMTILDRLIGAMTDMRLHTEAFETARQNMESLLSLPNVQDSIEYGVSETHPEIQWQTIIEPFYEPITSAMWIRAVCSAGYTDSKGQYQEVELEHWLTNLPANVVRQIIQQQRMEEEYLDLLSGTSSGMSEAALQETTIAYLTEAGLNVDAYTSFLERQRRRKLEYISTHGFDDHYEAFIEELRQEEDEFLDKLGMDFDKYNVFAQTYVPRTVRGFDPSAPDAPQGDIGNGSAGPDSPADPPPADDGWPTLEEMKERGFPDWLIDLIQFIRQHR